jgi:type IV secretory pathway VirB3-like protein
MTSVATRRFTVAGVLADAAHLLAAVLFIPFAILAIGAPFALVIAGILWLARMARAAL